VRRWLASFPCACGHCARSLSAIRYPLRISMNRWLRRLLYPLRGPLRVFWIWLHRQLDPLAARVFLSRAQRNPAVMGVAVVVMRGDEGQAVARITQVLEYVARSPRHFSRLCRTIAVIGVGAPPISHGRFVPKLRACHLAVRELQVHSIPALAATLVHAATEARLRRAVFDRRAGTAGEWSRLRVLCARASTEFLDRAQARSASGLSSA